MKTKKFQNFENCSLKCKKKIDNDFIQNFWEFLKNVKNCSLKMQKIDFSGKLMGLPKPPEDILSITKTIWRGRPQKGIPYSISDWIVMDSTFQSYNKYIDYN